MNEYRINESTGEVYEWSDSAEAYIFIGNLNGRTERQFIEDMQESYYMGNS